MKKLLLKFVIFLPVLFMVDIGLGQLIESLFTKTSASFYKEIQYVLNESEDQIIIVGSSSAKSNISPFIISDSLGMTAWNAGRGGQTIPYWFMAVKSICERTTPDLVIINARPGIFENSLEYGFQRAAGALRIFYDAKPEIRPIIDRASKHEKYLIHSNIYRTNSTYLRLIPNNENEREFNNRGWSAKDYSVIKPEQYPTVTRAKYDKVLDTPKSLFVEMIDYLKEKEVNFLVVVAPTYNIEVEQSGFTDWLDESGTPYLDLSNDEIIHESDYWLDAGHMNIEGSIRFSQELSKRIIDQGIIEHETIN